MGVKVQAVGRPDVAPFPMPNRFRTDVAYFCTPLGNAGVPADLAEGEYWIDLGQAKDWLADGVIYLVSPLDSQNQAEIELTEDQENWLNWLIEHQVQRVSVQSASV